MSLTVERGKAYLDAGADLVFVPFVVDPQAMHLEGTWNEVEQSFFGFVEAEALSAKDGD